MGCKQSSREVDLMISLDSRYFEDSELLYHASLSSPVQELFREARKRQKNAKDHFDMKIILGNNVHVDSSSTVSLKELGVSENSFVKLAVLANIAKIKVLIQTDPPKKTTVTLGIKKCIKVLKQKIMKDVDSDDIIILHRNINLPNSTLIKQLNLKENESLSLILKNSKLAAIWRYREPGFIIEGLCMNSECHAYKQRVSICKGYGSFELSNETTSSHQCPICTQELSKILNCGLAWCTYTADYILSDVKLSKSESLDYYYEIPNDWQLAHIAVTMLI